MTINKKLASMAEANKLVAEAHEEWAKLHKPRTDTVIGATRRLSTVVSVTRR